MPGSLNKAIKRQQRRKSIEQNSSTTASARIFSQGGFPLLLFLKSLLGIL